MDDKLYAPPPCEVFGSETEGFYQDVVAGLSRPLKHLDSKYFYDERGDALFQQIMNMPEYYLTRCELEIFKERTAEIAEAVACMGEPFDLIELGPGDGIKSMILLAYLARQGADFSYLPIDISANILRVLRERMAERLPRVRIQELHGDYFDMLGRVGHCSARRKVVLFLGSNIGNMEQYEASAFCNAIRRYLQAGDIALIGFDLQKDPEIILKAYNDPAGITAAFNLNLLQRINRELGGDFDVSRFRHYPLYDPGTGVCRSYLISLKDQRVAVGDRIFHFHTHEAIHTEISRKYTAREIHRLATESGFSLTTHISDSRGWFTDAIWKAI